jgi:hypothetical protein
MISFVLETVPTVFSCEMTYIILKQTILLYMSLVRDSVNKRSNLKSSIFWDITACSPLKVNLRFGGTCRLHRQGRRIIQARKQREAGSKQ